MTPSHPTRIRVRQALGYVGLGLLNEASDAIEAIDFAERFLPEVLAARLELALAAKHWDSAVGLGRELVFRQPDLASGWIGQAYALRELQRLAEAKAVLLEAAPLHAGTSAILHYNLACYHALLGELPAARERLQIACRMDQSLCDTALDDADLQALRDEDAGRVSPSSRTEN